MHSTTSGAPLQGLDKFKVAPALLVSTSHTVAGEALAYPEGAAACLTAAIVTLLPGEATGWHRHAVPAFGYVLEGTLTIDYGAHGRQTFGPGEAIVEAMAVAHNGYNAGVTPMRILAVFMGADGVPNTTPVDDRADQGS